MTAVEHLDARPFLSLATLDAFRDRVLLRDPRGRSRRPGIQPARRGGEPGLLLGDNLNLFLSYKIRRSSGRRFVEATGDENPIHREGNIVPGAMTVSKLLLPLEVLLPSLRVERLKIQFKRPALYGEATRACFSWREDQEGVQIQAKVYHPGGLMARCQMQGVLGEKRPATRPPLLHPSRVDRVRSYFHSLRVDSRAFLEQEGRPNFVYPLAFMASLPSGEMVRNLRGHGGILNSLRLDFSQTKRLPIGRNPEVLLEPSRFRTTVRKIVTRITEGLETYCHGFALVHPPTSVGPGPAE